MTSWITDIAGELKVYVNLKANGVVKSFGIVKLVILDGANPSNDTITEAQYQLLLDNINN